MIFMMKIATAPLNPKAVNEMTILFFFQSPLNNDNVANC